jgi:hypothetical protein
MFISGINNTGDKLFGGVNETADKFITCVNDTDEKLFSCVYDTADKFFANVNDTADKTMLTIPACLDLKMKNKQNSIYYSKVHPSKPFNKYEKNVHLKIFPLLSPVSFTPLINIYSRILPQIFEKIRKGTLRGRGDTDL